MFKAISLMRTTWIGGLPDLKPVLDQCNKNLTIYFVNKLLRVGFIRSQAMSASQGESPE
jgi:hypothetical protein